MGKFSVEYCIMCHIMNLHDDLASNWIQAISPVVPRIHILARVSEDDNEAAEQRYCCQWFIEEMACEGIGANMCAVWIRVSNLLW